MPTQVAVIGAGSFGRNHLRVYRELEATHDVQLAAVVDAEPTARANAAALYNIPAFATLEELLAACPALQAASICVPTTRHAAVAEQLLNANLDLLIEKPFASTLEEADRILALAQSRQRIVAVGHLERFNPAVTAVVSRLNRPVFFEAHRLSIFTPRSLDVDVVLDLMIHDLDIVLALAQSPVHEVRAVGLPILSRKTDIANVRVEFASGCVANFTASRVSTETVRKLRLFQPHQYLSLDFARQELVSIDVDPALAALLAAGANPLAAGANPPAKGASPLAAGTNPLTAGAHPLAAGILPPAAAPASHPSAGLNFEKLDLPRAEPLRLELEDFFHAIATRTAPRVPGKAGREALALALAINTEIATHAKRAGLL